MTISSSTGIGMSGVRPTKTAWVRMAIWFIGSPTYRSVLCCLRLSDMCFDAGGEGVLDPLQMVVHHVQVRGFGLREIFAGGRLVAQGQRAANRFGFEGQGDQMKAVTVRVFEQA